MGRFRVRDHIYILQCMQLKKILKRRVQIPNYYKNFSIFHKERRLKEIKNYEKKSTSSQCMIIKIILIVINSKIIT